VNRKEISGIIAAVVLLGGELTVHCLGFGGVGLTGEGKWCPEGSGIAYSSPASASVSGAFSLEIGMMKGFPVHAETFTKHALRACFGMLKQR